MRHPTVNLLTVTGGEGVVHAAMQSGKRAICAGPGNPPVVVDETADLDAGRARDRPRRLVRQQHRLHRREGDLRRGDDRRRLKRSMLAHGAYEIDAGQLERLMKVIFTQVPPPGKAGPMNKAFIGKNAAVLLKEIGIDVGDEIRLIVAEVDADHPLVVTEQMMPIMPLVRVRDADEGIDLAKKVEHGFRHTAVMYSKNLDHLSRMARVMDCSIFVKNAPSLAGSGRTAGKGSAPSPSPAPPARASPIRSASAASAAARSRMRSESYETDAPILQQGDDR